MRPVSIRAWFSLVAVLAYSAAACAQTPPALKQIIGEVTSIDAAAKQIKLKGDNGAAYTVMLADNTSFLRVAPGEKDLKKATKIAFTDVMVGDRALALEKDSDAPARAVVIMTKADLAQKHQHDQAEWRTRSVTGVVTALNAANKEVTVTTRGRDSKTMTIDASAAEFRRYSPDSVQFADAKPSSFADLQPGDTVRALGDKNEDGTHLKAEELISGAFETIAGTVDSVDATTGEVRITNLQTKKPVVVRTNPNSLLRRLDTETATRLARRLRPNTVAADGPAQGAAAAGARPPSGEDAAPQGGRTWIPWRPGRWWWRSPANPRTDAATIALGIEEGRRSDCLQFERSWRFRGHRLRVCRGRGAIPGRGAAHRRTSKLRILESRCQRRRRGPMIPADRQTKSAK